MNSIRNSVVFLSALATSGCASLQLQSDAKAQCSTETPTIYEFESDPQGFNTKTIFIDSGCEVFAFDAQFTEKHAQMSLDFLRTKTNRPVTHLIVTHPNPDKFNGASVFQKQGAKVVMSAATAASIEEVHSYKKYFFVNVAKMFSEENYPKPIPADVLFEDRLTLGDAGNLQIILRERHQAGVSGNQTIAHIPALNALIVGDLVHHKSHAWLEGGIQGGKAIPALSSWRKILIDLKSESAQSDPIVYGGRGESGNASEVFDEQIRYLESAEKITADFVSKEGDLLARDPQKAYSLLTERFSARFPDYALPYMIQFGIYGLVEQLNEKK